MTWPKNDVDHLMVNSTEMAKLEDLIISRGLPVESLMEKAASGASSWLIDQAMNLVENGVVLLIGPGHNGGDGLVVARELHLLGIEVFIWCPLGISRTLTAKILHTQGVLQLKF